MTCTQTQILLDAYADTELGRITAFRVRRHLAGCPACAAQLADIQRLNTSVHAWRDVSASASLKGRIAAMLPSTASAPLQTRDRHVACRAALGLAGVAAAGVGLWFLPGKPSQPTLAYADVERAMQQVRTVSWNETMEFYGPAGHPAQSATSQTAHWLRRNPPAVASVGHLQGRFQDLADKRGELMHLAPGVYVVFNPYPGRGTAAKPVAAEVEEMLKQFTQPQATPPQIVHMHGQITVTTNFSPTKSKNIVLEGQSRVLFSRTQKITLTDLHAGKRHLYSEMKLWADPLTGRIVRTESRNTQREDPEDWNIATSSNFHYDQPAPSGVFDWSPPPGAKVLSGRQAWDALLYFTRHPAF